MSKHHRMSAWVSKIILASVLAFSAAGTALAGQESTIFTYDGQDFIRKHTTLVTEDGKSAVNTKLDRDNPGYKALIQKRSYTGEVTAFGQKCDGHYAPLTDKGGRLTGALF
ncbi:MAG: Cache 3/Cache 2 fusion domain-containing protein, partial [Burkholderiales bacterium]